ncbi:KDO2-lipid IV(A) lauroyltransferase [Desulfobaculum xiamenense]|uniref:KDO2-lipid IV(A) lauroyltransferase n=1 Tax=Desulfobaculum xiamenense TaxID=995050 RepID=A0A846QEY3_9BACT|nr:lysophospholipid acyltransferase family protein [Desulfobaculum xiamenense]NJB66821.1 KDO2-lipid IV(A) lauroyltransferase [Desulfobaculum xiamenense]
MREIVYELLARSMQGMSLDAIDRWGARMGDLLWLTLPERRQMATETMARQLDLPLHTAQRMARNSFRNTGRSFLEILLSSRVDWRFIHERLHIATPDAFRAFQDLDRPVVIATAHMGAWELLAGIYQLLVHKHPKQIVVRRPKDEALHRLMTRLRSRPGVDVIPHRMAAPQVLRCLRKGGVTAFLVDHNSSTSEALFMPFLKDIAAVNMGPALLAVRAEACICPVFIIRNGQGGYELHNDTPLDTRTLTGSRDERIQKAAEFYTRAVVRMIRAYPEQWYWLHRRWKTQPPEGWRYGGPLLES